VLAAVNEVWLVIYRLYSSGHSFVTSHPPIILFAVCIIWFTVIIYALAYYVSVTENIRNPDVSKVSVYYYGLDWE